jgi:hypothetical protein
MLKGIFCLLGHESLSNEDLGSPGGVAQWTSHPPQEQEDPGSNPARV